MDSTSPGETLRAAFRDFLDKAQVSGPDTVAFVYLSGYDVQLDGEKTRRSRLPRTRRSKRCGFPITQNGSPGSP